MTEKLNGAAAFFRNLADNGIDTIFACPGTSEMQVVDELGYSDLKPGGATGDLRESRERPYMDSSSVCKHSV